MNLPGYHLNKEGSYYYLYLNRMHAHVQAISSKLEHLEVKVTAEVTSEVGQVHEGGDATKVASELGPAPTIRADDNMTKLSGDGETRPMMADVDRCDGVSVKPVVFQELVMVVAGENSVVADARTVGEKEEPVETGTNKDIPEVDGEKKLERSEGKAELASEGALESCAVQTGSNTDVSAGKDTWCSVMDGQKGALQGKDIKISIIRPSPVRQVPKKESVTLSPSDASSRQTTDRSEVITTDAARDETETAVDGRENDESVETTTVLPPVILRRRHKSGEPVSQPTHDLSTLERRATLDGSAMVWASRSLQQLQVSTPVGSSETIDRSGLKRMHSAATLEKYRHDNRPRKALDSSATHTPARSRHQSGLQTPKSTSLVDTTSSRSSVGEEGKERVVLGGTRFDGVIESTQATQVIMCFFGQI